MKKYDILVIGGGPAGYPAAIRASQNGAKVAIIEKDRFGGECTNYGCIPTKAFLKGAKIAVELTKYPFIKGDALVDFKALSKWVSRVVSRSSRGVEYLLKGYDVDIIKGEAIFKDAKTVKVGDEEYSGYKVVLALGSKPLDIPNFKVDGEYIHNNRTILSIDSLPESILIIGAGYIGVEYATVFSSLGVKVYVVELLDRILPLMDKDFSSLMEKKLKDMNVEILTGVKADSYSIENNKVVTKLSSGDQIVSDMVLVAVGRRPNTEYIKELGIGFTDKGFVKVNERQETNVKGVYAAGDLTGQPMLAHKAFLEGVIAGENASGGNMYRVSKYIPSVIYTEPELVSVGYTFEELKSKDSNIMEKKYPIGGLAKAYIEGEIDGFIKFVYDDKGVIHGIHMAAPNASELAGEATYILETSSTLEDVALTVHPHPTVSEALKEAAEYILGKPYHYLLK